MDLFKRNEQNVTFRKTVDRDGWGSDPTPPEPIIEYSYKYGSAANDIYSPETYIPNVYSDDGVTGDYFTVTPTQVRLTNGSFTGLTRRTILVENLFSPHGALINSGWVSLNPLDVTTQREPYAQVRVVDPERGYYGDYKNIYPYISTPFGYYPTFFIDFKSVEPIDPIIEISINNTPPNFVEMRLEYSTTALSLQGPLTFEVNQANSFLTRDGRYSFKSEGNFLFDRTPIDVEGATYYQEPALDGRLVEEIQTVIEPPIVPPIPDDTTVPAIVRYNQNIAGDETGVTDGSTIAFIKPKYKEDIENFTINDILIVNDVEFEIKKIDLRGVLPTDYSLRVEGVRK